MAFYRCGAQDPTGNATEANVLYGKTFSNTDGTDKTGSMPNKSGFEITIANGTEAKNGITIDKGYHDGSKKAKVDLETRYTYHAKRTEQIDVSYANSKLPSNVRIQPLDEFTGLTPLRARMAEYDIYGATGPTQQEYIRYVNTDNVPNYNYGTYTYPSSMSYTDMKKDVDLGETNSFRRINALEVYKKGYERAAQGAAPTVISTYEIPDKQYYIGTKTFTCTWDGALMIVSSGADYAKPNYDDVEITDNGSPLDSLPQIMPNPFPICGNSSSAFTYIYWVYGVVNNKTKIKISTTSIGVKQIKVFKIVSKYAY